MKSQMNTFVFRCIVFSLFSFKIVYSGGLATKDYFYSTDTLLIENSSQLSPKNQSEEITESIVDPESLSMNIAGSGLLIPQIIEIEKDRVHARWYREQFWQINQELIALLERVKKFELEWEDQHNSPDFLINRVSLWRNHPLSNNQKRLVDQYVGLMEKISEFVFGSTSGLSFILETFDPRPILGPRIQVNPGLQLDFSERMPSLSLKGSLHGIASDQDDHFVIGVETNRTFLEWVMASDPQQSGIVDLPGIHHIHQLSVDSKELKITLVVDSVFFEILKDKFNPFFEGENFTFTQTLFRLGNPFSLTWIIKETSLEQIPSEPIVVKPMLPQSEGDPEIALKLEKSTRNLYRLQRHVSILGSDGSILASHDLTIAEDSLMGSIQNDQYTVDQARERYISDETIVDEDKAAEIRDIIEQSRMIFHVVSEGLVNNGNMYLDLDLIVSHLPSPERL